MYEQGGGSGISLTDHSPSSASNFILLTLLNVKVQAPLYHMRSEKFPEGLYILLFSIFSPQNWVQKLDVD